MDGSSGGRSTDRAFIDGRSMQAESRGGPGPSIS